jgi:GT2 family glycosyltransferase
MHIDFSRLPLNLSSALLMGSVGHGHLLDLARMALERAGTVVGEASGETGLELLDLGADLLCAAWEEDPLDGVTAGQLLALNAKRPTLSPNVEQAVAAVATSWKEPENARYFYRLLARREMDKVRRFLVEQRDKEPDNPYWLKQAVGISLYEGDFDWVGEWLEKASYPHLSPLVEKVRGDTALSRGDSEEAHNCYARAVRELPCVSLEYLRGEALFRMGQRDQALGIWQKILARRPWHTNLFLRLYDGMNDRDRDICPLSGSVLICLYSYNKSDELAATLDSLLATELGEARIRVLDNGSSDDTLSRLESFRQRLGPERFGVVELPVNVGAAAARNWLMKLPEAAKFDYIVYMDDDVRLPVDWLGKLGACAEAYPEAGVWGCRVVDEGNPAVLQSVDIALKDPDPSTEEDSRRFKISDLHHQNLDFGQFSYTRPCATVTGCCHMFRFSRLEEAGGFDLRFSPSQYDDIDHDIRMCLAGRPPAYQGHLLVKHRKRTGKSSHQDSGELGNALANMHKLQRKYSDEEIRAVQETVLKARQEDLAAKAEALRVEFK